MKSFKEKIAVVTGATSGIGLVISLSLLKEGIKTYLIGRDFTQLEKEISDRKLSKEKACFIFMEFNQNFNVDEFIKETQDEDSIDILIHCAGTISFGAMQNENIEDLDKQYQINVRAPYVLTQALLPKIKKASGDILFMNSTAGINYWKKVGQYSASKHALKAIANSLRKELIDDKVRVSSLFLGSVDTPMQVRNQKLKGIQTYNPEIYMTPEIIADIVLFMIKLPNYASITDIIIKQNR